MSSEKVIPGLFSEVYTPGSRHIAPTPQLRTSNVDGNEVYFEWIASGSNMMYHVTAKGSIVISSWDGRGCPIFDRNAFSVVCSCPDGDRQNVANSTSLHTLSVCKHAKAALDSVCDPNATKKIAGNKKAKIEEQQSQRAEQDQRFSGERERIEYGLSKRSDAEIVKLLKERAGTVDGLEALSKLFPASVMQPKKSIRCGRCKKEYDPQVRKDLVCREEHPDDSVSTEWESSKKSYSHCSRCGKSFGHDGYHSWGCDNDDGYFCFESTHVPENEYDKDKDPIVAEFDDSDE